MTDYPAKAVDATAIDALAAYKDSFDPEEFASCYYCKFWDGNKFRHGNPNASSLYDEDYGRCRRFPPVSVAKHEDEEFDQEAIWPIVHEQTWCGEHAFRKDWRDRAAKANPQDADPALLRISDFCLTARAANLCKNYDINSLGDLARQSRHSLSRAPNVGKATMVELERLLHSRGLEFRMEL